MDFDYEDMTTEIEDARESFEIMKELQKKILFRARMWVYASYEDSYPKIPKPETFMNGNGCRIWIDSIDDIFESSWLTPDKRSIKINWENSSKNTHSSVYVPMDYLFGTDTANSEKEFTEYLQLKARFTSKP